MSDEERSAYDFTSELVTNHGVSNPTYDEAVRASASAASSTSSASSVTSR